jgi:hypothetical protein
VKIKNRVKSREMPKTARNDLWKISSLVN